MKKLILFACLSFPLMFYCCETEVHRFFTCEYIYENATDSSIRVTGRDAYTDEKSDIFVLSPNEEVTLRIKTPGDFAFPFWKNGESIYMIIADNGKRYVISELYHEPEPTGLFREDSYEFVSETEATRTYRFIFTDDYFKDGEPIENMTE